MAGSICGQLPVAAGAETNPLLRPDLRVSSSRIRAAGVRKDAALNRGSLGKVTNTGGPSFWEPLDALTNPSYWPPSLRSSLARGRPLIESTSTICSRIRPSFITCQTFFRPPTSIHRKPSSGTLVAKTSLLSLK